jgi:predicted dehydrogenase
METIKNVGLIECGNSTMPDLSNDFNPLNGFRLIKILSKTSAASHPAKEFYPEAEMVMNTHDIIGDHSIELVIVAAPGNHDLGLVAEALGAGKQVRVL